MGQSLTHAFIFVRANAGERMIGEVRFMTANLIAAVVLLTAVVVTARKDGEPACSLSDLAALLSAVANLLALLSRQP
ncbi:hypothetical protein GCM10010315_11710 [Streptomyces luteosporeus]|uniref:Uncharacterized protein n=2 Tax=Streptomyces TaxID=1883 RepID=A0ABN3TKR6_9ACTN